jgi:hypothetical protein
MDIFIGPKYRVRRSVTAAAEQPAVTDILLCDTDLPNKTVNQLDAVEIFTLGELAEKDSYFILNLPNMGETSLWLLKELLDKHSIPNTLGELFSIVNGRRVFKRPRKPAERRKPRSTNVKYERWDGNPGPDELRDLDLFI